MIATSTAKMDGDLSSEEKTKLLQLFQSELNRSEQEASDLLMSSIYLFGDGEDVLAKPEKILQNTLDSFSREQAQSVMELLREVAAIDERNSERKTSYVQKVEATFDAHFKVNTGW